MTPEEFWSKVDDGDYRTIKFVDGARWSGVVQHHAGYAPDSFVLHLSGASGPIRYSWVEDVV